jgi:hypothetical protein
VGLRIEAHLVELVFDQAEERSMTKEEPVATTDDPKRPRVFITYSQDSPEHMTRVRGLAERLGRDGVDCSLDQWEQFPPEGWPQWMRRQVAENDRVLVVCSEGYLDKSKRQKPEGGRGVEFESSLILQNLYDAGTWNKKFVPVLLDDLPVTVIPDFLRSYGRYRADEESGYTELLRLLTDQPAYRKPGPGVVKRLPPAPPVSDVPAESGQRSAEAVGREFEHVATLVARIKQFSRPARSDIDFPVTLSVGRSYDDLLSQAFVAAGLTASALLDHADYSDILIHSPGGFGKTKYLGLLVEEAIRRGWVPFYLDLKHGITGESEQLPAEFGLGDLFDAFSVAAEAEVFSRALDSGWSSILFVDGLNELQRDKSTDIARLIDKLSRKEPRLRIVAADRMTPYAGMEAFLRARIDPVPEQFVRTHLPAGTQLSPADLNLLSVPFFLDLRLKLAESHTGGMRRAEMFDLYFSKIAEVSTETRKALGRQAYEAYARFSSRTFDRAWWTDALPGGVAGDLESAGITVPTKPGAGEAPRLVFRHQLLHDFLVGEALSRMQTKEWTGGTLDNATFRGNSIECLSFAGELLGTRADELLERIYDWSYSAAIDTISDLERSVTPSPVSREMLFAVIALNAEKRFDLFENTALGSVRRVSALLPDPAAKAFLEAKTYDEVLELVRKFSAGERFREWRRVFLLRGKIGESDVRTITAGPIIGWTAANSLRRCALKGTHLAQLRGIILGAASHGSLRWRVTHVLAAFPSKENVDLLLELALSDPEFWVQYGATRSLFEIVSRPGSPFRRRVLEALWARLPNLENDVLIRQMRVGVFIGGAGQDWYGDVYDLVERASNLPLAELEKDEWIKQLARVKERAGR